MTPLADFAVGLSAIYVGGVVVAMIALSIRHAVDVDGEGPSLGNGDFSRAALWPMFLWRPW